MTIHQRLPVEQLHLVLLVVRDGRGGALGMAPASHAVQKTCCTFAATLETTPPRSGPLLRNRTRYLVGLLEDPPPYLHGCGEPLLSAVIVQPPVLDVEEEVVQPLSRGPELPQAASPS
eukprot:5906034-Pyramimonas_sp.AAC.1